MGTGKSERQPSSLQAPDQAITDLINQGEDLAAPMKSIGEEMVNRTQQ
ncbi:hypothetical protein JJO83_16120 [Halomonas aquamarina]|nr:hypothetical protein [Halomonas aquamarina]MDC8444199.1 hypothetical protein [Halomonas aquamarina]